MKRIIFTALLAIVASLAFAQYPPANAQKVEGASFIAWLNKNTGDPSDRYEIVFYNKTSGRVDVEYWFPGEDRPRVSEWVSPKATNTEKLNKGCYILKLRRKDIGDWMEMCVYNIK